MRTVCKLMYSFILYLQILMLNRSLFRKWQLALSSGIIMLFDSKFPKHVSILLKPRVYYVAL